MFNHISDNGLHRVMNFEGFVARPAPDPVGIMTVGHGHVVRKWEEKKYAGRTMSRDEAFALLKDDMVNVRSICLGRWVKVPVTQNQADALHSFVFNIGCMAFQRSTFLHKLNNLDYVGAALEFHKWNKAGNPLHELPGLTTRRSIEESLFAQPEDAKLMLAHFEADEVYHKYAACAEGY